MTATVEIHGTVARIILSGNLDYSTQDEIRDANQRALSHKRAREIHVNFAGVTFLDSSAIRALIILQKEADAAGKSLILMNCNEFTREIFEIGGFDQMFKFR